MDCTHHGRPLPLALCAAATAPPFRESDKESALFGVRVWLTRFERRSATVVMLEIEEDDEAQTWSLSLAQVASVARSMRRLVDLAADPAVRAYR